MISECRKPWSKKPPTTSPNAPSISPPGFVCTLSGPLVVLERAPGDLPCSSTVSIARSPLWRITASTGPVLSTVQPDATALETAASRIRLRPSMELSSLRFPRPSRNATATIRPMPADDDQHDRPRREAAAAARCCCRRAPSSPGRGPSSSVCPRHGLLDGRLHRRRTSVVTVTVAGAVSVGVVAVVSVAAAARRCRRRTRRTASPSATASRGTSAARSRITAPRSQPLVSRATAVGATVGGCAYPGRQLGRERGRRAAARARRAPSA